MAYTSKVVNKARFRPKDAYRHTLTRATSHGLERSLSDLDAKQALSALGTEIIKKVRSEIKQTAFSDAAKKRLSKALTVKLQPRSLQLVVKDPLWRYLVDGRRKGQMVWLKKATRPIPIVTDSGKVIFRTATAKSMSDGRWIHPGRPALNLVDRAKTEARKVIKKKLAKILVAEIQKRTR